VNADLLSPGVVPAQLVERGIRLHGCDGSLSQALLDDLELSEPLPTSSVSEGPISQRCLLGGCTAILERQLLVDRLGERGFQTAIDTADHRVNIVSLSSAGLRVVTRSCERRPPTHHWPDSPGRIKKHLHDLLAKNDQAGTQSPSAGANRLPKA